MKKIHVPNAGPDDTNVKKALAVGIKQCESANCGSLTIITPLKDLDRTIVGKVLGDAATKKLMKGESVKALGIELHYESVATVQKVATPKVGLVFYAPAKDIQKLDELDFDCVIYVPWLEKEGQEWATKWNAETIGATTQAAEVNLPAEVLESLKNLTSCVNLSSGLSHPSDKGHAKRIFAELREQKIKWNPNEIEKWAVRNNWKAGDAKELSELSARYL